MKLRDYIDLNFDASKLHHTKEGYLTGKLCVTGAGVFFYRDSKGEGIIGRLRPRDQVEASVQSLISKPVTYNHPNEFVNPENAKKLSVGLSDSDVEWDGVNAFITITITDKNAIEAIERGELKAISCGYECDIVANEGVWQGTPYTEVQKNIIYNHIALVSEGRAGDSVRFSVADSADIDFNKKGVDMNKHIIDGVECMGDQAFIDAYQKQSATIAELQKELDGVKAARDAAEATVKTLKEQNSDEAIAKAVDAKLALVEKAKGFGVECDSKTADSAIVAAIIAKAFDGVSLEGKSADYIYAMFDAACSNLSKEPAKQADASLESHAVQNDVNDPEQAYKQMCDSVAKLNKEA